MSFQLTFHGAAQMVTGSKHLLQTPSGKEILLDCGMVQGRGKESDVFNRDFGFDPMAIDALILSHAHIDHSGLIPRLVKEGFSGPIFCTMPTFELCKIMLADSAHIQEYEIQFLNKKRSKQKKMLLEPLYDQEDVRLALSLFHPLPYNHKLECSEEVHLTFLEAGHILGSAAVHLELFHKGQTRRLHFSGDVGRYEHSILRPPAPFPPSDYIICESTYGDEDHEPADQQGDKLRKIIMETCVDRGGKVIIPAFSLGRTQELVLELNKLSEAGKIPSIPVFVDSPLSVNATDIVKRFANCYNNDLKQYKLEDPDPFGFDQLYYLKDKEDSMKLNHLKGPAIIISSSGMAEAGRIKHHLANNLEDYRNTVLIVGYCEPGSLGGRLARGEKQVSIFGEMVGVNADVRVMKEYSAHAGQSELLRYLEGQEQAKTVFLVHGETEPMNILKLKLETKGFRKVIIPHQGESVILN